VRVDDDAPLDHDRRRVSGDLLLSFVVGVLGQNMAVAPAPERPIMCCARYMGALSPLSSPRSMAARASTMGGAAALDIILISII
jgi:hypothetical protein